MSDREIAKKMGIAALEKKAKRVVLQDLRNRSDICDYQLVCSATNERQAQAICNSIEDTMKRSYSQRPLAIEGKQTGSWILIDYGSIIAHIFLEEIRDYYALENLWPDVQSVTLESKS